MGMAETAEHSQELIVVLVATVAAVAADFYVKAETVEAALQDKLVAAVEAAINLMAKML